MLLDDSQSDVCGFQAPASGLEIPNLVFECLVSTIILLAEEGHTVEAQHIHH